MKRLIVRNLDNIQTHGADFETQEELNACVNEHSGKAFGKLERLKPTVECTQEELNIAIATENIEIDGEQVEHKRLPQMFTTEVIDLDLDADYQLQKVQEQRRNAYPSVHDIIEALMEAEEGNTTKLEQAKLDRAAVKALYPKPE